MFRIIGERLRQKHRTFPFPGRDPELPPRFRGLPVIDVSASAAEWSKGAAVCPTGALRVAPGPRLDLGTCLFCGACSRSTEPGAVRFTNGFRLAARRREDLILAGGPLPDPEPLGRELRRLYGRSLRLRQVSAGGCNACEADLNVLGTPVFDIGRFGIEFVASPRHADGLMVTGPVSRNMLLALRKTYAALPPPRLVIASGACAISGGPYIGHPECCDGVSELLPVDLFIPGCPPHPWTTLHGLLALLGRLK